MESETGYSSIGGMLPYGVPSQGVFLCRAPHLLAYCEAHTTSSLVIRQPTPNRCKRTPARPPPTTSQAELSLMPNTTTSATTATTAVHRSTTAACPSCHVTPAMSPREATFTPSRSVLAHGDWRTRGRI